MSNQAQVFQRRYLITHSHLTYSIVSHLVIGGVCSGYMYLSSSLGHIALYWYLGLCAVLLLRLILQTYLVSNVKNGFKYQKAYDLLFAFCPTLNALAWGVGYCLILQLGEYTFSLSATLVLTAMAFTGFTHLTLSRASYIGFFVSCFVPAIVYFLIFEPNIAVVVVLIMGVVHFLVFNRLVYNISTDALRSDEKQKNLIQKLTEAEEQLKLLSEIDPLTGLSNRLSYQKQYKRMRYDCMLSGATLNIALIDIDYFKQLNDTHGHLVGDQVLTSLAQLLQTQLGEGTIVGRFGGEEFIVFQLGKTASQFELTLDNLREYVSSNQLIEGEHYPISISIGANTIESPMSLSTCLAPIDEALYKAKALGRNRVCHA
ncbi:GGDEF domain-containing protein [Vibrio ulleungensis]|uniref:diguanylate cyclase n=1 Tax=Vibrio ulleungensis TaxID=2807619 RepID=A0ABS2HG70_9VIBR|nr:GGDEF domain-containing protein [Vibrio ulleungensis]MBM7035437.1 GGDEF domain-containing protein [Vibrio ulleungensis]